MRTNTASGTFSVTLTVLAQTQYFGKQAFLRLRHH